MTFRKQVIDSLQPRQRAATGGRIDSILEVNMTLREYFLQRWQAEAPAFLRVLKALPKDRIGYKPHDRSPSAEQLVWTLTAELRLCLDMILKGKAEWKAIPPPPLDQMLTEYERLSKQLARRVSKMDNKAWKRKSAFYYGGKMVSEEEIGPFLWFILFDAIHHRGQLSAYLRPMGGKVPSIYGPSADEPSA
jgi:uncharacterized damage-inducible protein DinB